MPTIFYTYILLLCSVKAVSVWEHTPFLSGTHTFCRGLQRRPDENIPRRIPVFVLPASAGAWGSDVSVPAAQAPADFQPWVGWGESLLPACPRQGPASLCLGPECMEQSAGPLMTYAWSELLPSGLPQGLDPSWAPPCCRRIIHGPWGSRGPRPITVGTSVSLLRSSLCLVRLNCEATESWSLWYHLIGGPRASWGPILRMGSEAPRVRCEAAASVTVTKAWGWLWCQPQPQHPTRETHHRPEASQGQCSQSQASFSKLLSCSEAGVLTAARWGTFRPSSLLGDSKDLGDSFLPSYCLEKSENESHSFMPNSLQPHGL